MNQTEKPIMDKRDREILKEYNTHRLIEDREILADYVRALVKFVIVAGADGTYDMGGLLKMNGVASDLEDGEYSVEEVKEWLDELDVEDIQKP